MKYKFQSKTARETIGLIEANNQSEAEEKFAEGKKLPLKTFLKLFEVKINGDEG
tara:strand:- start:1048 stop:1209 length:162 start_codon:yes stop_codon:yes gene_type:complete